MNKASKAKSELMNGGKQLDSGHERILASDDMTDVMGER